MIIVKCIIVYKEESFETHILSCSTNKEIGCGLEGRAKSKTEASWTKSKKNTKCNIFAGTGEVAQ